MRRKFSSASARATRATSTSAFRSGRRSRRRQGRSRRGPGRASPRPRHPRALPAPCPRPGGRGAWSGAPGACRWRGAPCGASRDVPRPTSPQQCWRGAPDSLADCGLRGVTRREPRLHSRLLAAGSCPRVRSRVGLLPGLRGLPPCVRLGPRARAAGKEPCHQHGGRDRPHGDPAVKSCKGPHVRSSRW